MNVQELLEQVAGGSLSVDAAMQQLGSNAEDDITFARIDLTRAKRQGMPEVIYSPGKTPDQIAAIARRLVEAGQDVLATRASADDFSAVHAAIPEAIYHEPARAITVDVGTRPNPIGRVSVVCAGTSDMPVAEEAALTAERMGARVDRIHDVGVSGLHRLGRHLASIRESRAIVVVAGMEGALASVVGGLVDRPIIAVPTSVGYGANFAGLAPLLSMLNSCSSGVSVVNIDNGFGAGVSAALINRLGE